MSSRGRTIVESALLVALLVAGVFVQHARGGLELRFLTLPLVLAPGAVRRALALLGLSAPAPGATIAFEVAAFTGLAVHPFGAWGHGLAGAGALVATFAPDPDGRESVLQVAGARALAVAATLIALWHLGTNTQDATWLFAAVLLGLAAPFGPGAPRAWTTRSLALWALLSAAGLLWRYDRDVPGVAASHVDLALAAMIVFGAAREWRSTALPTRARRLVLVVLGALVLANIYVLTADRLVAGEERVGLSSWRASHLEGHSWAADPPWASWRFVPEDATVLEDGRPLATPCAPLDVIASVGSGSYSADGDRVVWSSSDGTDPLANGRRYEVAFVREAYRSGPARVLFALACLALVAAWSAGVVDLAAAPSRRERGLLVAITLAALACGLPRGWDRIYAAPDTESYVQGFAMRPPLYPAFLAALDATPEVPRAAPPVERGHSRGHDAPRDRYIAVPRTQKVLTVLAVALLVWVLAGTFNVWLLGVATYLVAVADVAGDYRGAVSWNVVTLLSEGLNHPLVFVQVAATFAYLRRPSWPWGIVLALDTGLLLVNRPSNASLVAVFALLAVFHARRDGWRSTSRVAVLAAIALVPSMIACAREARTTGYFRAHAATGMHVFGSALEVATEDDVTAFEDPKVRELLRVCLVEDAPLRVDYRPYWDTCRITKGYVDQNIYVIALPAFDRVYADLPPGRARDFARDDVLLATGKRLIARHPLAWARFVLFHVRCVLRPLEHGLVALAALASLLFYRRTRAWPWLFCAYFAALPWIAILPSCCFNFPMPRYLSQLAFAERGALALFVCTLASAWRTGSSESPPKE